ncbi:hypothetical protein [Streptomyces griseus]|uniref:hypothetical protein n=1 Tax=Streptomyces griseus TaxID=1911 RepID=UPI0004C5DE8B|nr:hypothetical protein [Streptomyces griseus]
MLLNRRTRVLRTAAVAAGTSVALLLPAAAAFADDAAADPGATVFVVDTPKQGGDSWVHDLNGGLVAEHHARKR